MMWLSFYKNAAFRNSWTDWIVVKSSVFIFTNICSHDII